jgi:hypothetical protein
MYVLVKQMEHEWNDLVEMYLIAELLLSSIIAPPH